MSDKDISFVKEICKMGQEHDCCRYLVVGTKGFECAKVVAKMKKTLDDRGDSMVARADNCDGKRGVLNGIKKEKIEGELFAGVILRDNKLSVIATGLPEKLDEKSRAQLGLIVIHDALQKWARETLNAPAEYGLSVMVAELKDHWNFNRNVTTNITKVEYDLVKKEMETKI